MTTLKSSSRAPGRHAIDAIGAPAMLPFETDESLAPECEIDEIVFSDLRRRNITPSRLCSDAVFVRRAYIDVIGTLPTSEESLQFLTDESHDKRTRLIEALFARDEFAQYWAMKWCDVLRVKSEFPVDLWPMASQAYHHWVWSSIRENMPYDKFVWTMLTAGGSNFRDPAVNFYRSVPGRQPDTIARCVALTFMGARAEKWPKARLAGMAPFFSQIGFKSTDEWKEEIVEWDPAKASAWAAGGPAPQAVFPGGGRAVLRSDTDPREVFANWITAPNNPWLARCVVNRIWYWLLGRGIVQEPDDIRDDNPPGNAPLLAYLEKLLIDNHFDQRSVYRAILNSKVYRLSSIPRSQNPKAAGLFASYLIRRLDAEVLIDALNQLSGTGEEYSSEIPEPFTFLPPDQRAIDLPDGSISSSFLELFGRPGRDTGLESERDNRLTATQCLHMLNSSHIRNKVEHIPSNLGLVAGATLSNGLLDELYLSILSRLPTDGEREIASGYVDQSGGNTRAAVIDLAWASINSTEFLFRH